MFSEPPGRAHKNKSEKGTAKTVIEALKKYFNTNNDKMRVVNLPLSVIKPNPHQPRKLFDSVGLRELSASIEEFGVLQPISVRRAEDGFEIIAGERRFRAAESIGMKEIPAIVMNADENKSALLALLENLQREDLCFFEIAEGYQRLIREQGMTQDGLARKLGKSQSAVANKLRLLRLSPRVKKLIRDFSLSERHARALLNIPDEDRQLIAAQTICREHLNVRQSEDLIKTIMSEPPEERQRQQSVKIPTPKDVRIFTNTLKKALDIMKENGAIADMKKTDKEWGVEYVIKVRTEAP